MTTKYIEEHKEELEAMAELYEALDEAIFQYRAECIRELIRWENLRIK